MRILILGAGGVGSAAALIAARRAFPSHVVVADYDLERAEAAVAGTKDGRFVAAQLDASDQAAVERLIESEQLEVVLGATDPRFTMPIFRAALSRKIHYLDMAMSLSQAHPEHPYRHPHVMLGDEQFALADEWHESGRIALVGIGVEPGLADVFARYAADHLFSEIDEAGVRDGANLTVSGHEFAPSFSIWTTIEECLNPPVVYEEDRGWFTTEPFSEPEVFDFPEGIGPIECVNVEHEEVLLIPRWVDAKRVTFKYGLGDEFIEVLKTLHKLGLDKTEQVKVAGVTEGSSRPEQVMVSPRDVVAACLPDPAALGDRMTGKTCAGLWVRGTGKDGEPRSTYLYHVVDNEWSMREYGAQAVVWQTAVNPIVALELIANGTWTGAGVLGPEAFDAVPFLDLLRDGYDSPWGQREMMP
jgi:saccharopine dehydrogenase (NAD+, L-lysine forming)